MTPSKFKASQAQSGQAAATSAAHVTSAPAKHRRFLIAQIYNGGCSTVKLGPFRASEPDRPIPLEINQDLIRVQKVTKVFLAGRAKPARPMERLEYRDNELTHAMRSNLTSINALLSKTELDLRMTAEQAYLLRVTS